MKEKVLPKIRLKYYKIPKKVKGDKPSGIKCSWCFEPNIIHLGGGYKDGKGNCHNTCECCAVRNFREEEGFKTITAARGRRRRLFDVCYLFGEIIIDKYMEIKSTKNFKDLDNADDIFIKAGELYNYLFSKEEKIKLEEIESQDEIENQLRKRIFISGVNVEKLFKSF